MVAPLKSLQTCGYGLAVGEVQTQPRKKNNLFAVAEFTANKLKYAS